MLVLDPKKISKLIVLEGYSTRSFSKAIGYKSPTHLRRILDGKQKTVTPDRAALIARRLNVGMDKLFVPRLSTDAGEIDETDERLSA